jgi:hypothetical protein
MNVSILRALMTLCSPAWSFLMGSCFDDCTFAQSNAAFWTVIPTEPASLIASITSPACSRALVGMQPRWRHVPPTLSRSTMAIFRPRSAPRSAKA